MGSIVDIFDKQSYGLQQGVERTGSYEFAKNNYKAEKGGGCVF